MHHEPVLVPDWTLLIQLGIFFVAYFILNKLVFKPYLALLKSRREQTVGLREAAERDRQQAEKLRLEYQDFIKKERLNIGAWCDDERKKIQELERQQIQAARVAAAKANEAARAVLEEQKKTAFAKLESSANEFSSAIVSKMLGRKVQVSATPNDKHRTAENPVLG